MHLMLIPSIVIFAFALTLGGLWLVDRRRPHLLPLAGGFAGFGAALLVQVVELPPQSAFNAVASAILYASGATLLSIGIVRRAGRSGIPPPLLVLPTAMVALLAWFSYVDNDLLIRVYVLNFGLGAICLAGAWGARRLASGTLADRALLWLLVVFALHFFPRTLLTAGTIGHPDRVSFGHSDFWVATMYAGSIFGVLIGIVLVLVTVADFIATLQYERDTDALTATLNRRGVELRARQLLSQAEQRPVSLVAIDIDHFKRVNDRLGHQAGDLVLQGIGKLLNAGCRPGDLVGRIGGEEFVVVLPRTATAEAYALAERLRRALAATVMDEPEPGLTVTCSLGVVELRRGEDLWAGLYRADQLLYQAKRDGRDRTVGEDRATPLPPMPALLVRSEPLLLSSRRRG